MDHAVGDGQVPGTFGATSLLTPRQREIFDLIVVGTSNKEIARELGLSQGTVKIHIAKLFRKLGASSRRRSSCCREPRATSVLFNFGCRRTAE
jgi:DNA-binding NarL/FixJ family response regulator